LFFDEVGDVLEVGFGGKEFEGEAFGGAKLEGYAFEVPGFVV